MDRIRAQAIVHRGPKLLMVKHSHEREAWWCLPGGAVEPGETPAEAALRELQEECGVEGEIIREIGAITTLFGYRANTFLVDIGEQEIEMGSDPELQSDEQILVDVQWLALSEICERDRAYLFDSGLLRVEAFLEEITRWGDEISYPGIS